MININTYIIEKLHLNKDIKTDKINIKQKLYSIIKDVLEEDFNFSPYQYIISHDSVIENDEHKDYFIIRSNPNVRRQLTTNIKKDIYNIVYNKAKKEGIEDFIIDNEIDINKFYIYYINNE